MSEQKGSIAPGKTSARGDDNSISPKIPTPSGLSPGVAGAVQTSQATIMSPSGVQNTAISPVLPSRSSSAAAATQAMQGLVGASSSRGGSGHGSARPGTNTSARGRRGSGTNSMAGELERSSSQHTLKSKASFDSTQLHMGNSSSANNSRTVTQIARLESAWSPWIKRFAVNRSRAGSISRWQDKDVYQGDLKDGKRHGSGELLFRNFDRYVGEFVQGKMQGQGTLEFSNGDVYVGYVMNDAIHGKGRLVYANGDVFEGMFFEGKRSGRGVYRFSNGCIFEGFFVDDIAQGNCKVTLQGGDRLEINFEKGVAKGEGVLVIPGPPVQRIRSKWPQE